MTLLPLIVLSSLAQTPTPVIISTDCGCEMDDQWAITHLCLSPVIDVRAIITRINAAVERAVREYPEQWLWIHQRWKTRPPGEVVGPDGLPPKCVSLSRLEKNSQIGIIPTDTL